MKHLAIAALLGGLTACTAGPDYHLPETSLARADPVVQPFHGSSDSAFTTEPLPPHWWRLYESPELDQLVAAGLAANYDLRTAAATLDRASFLVQEAKATRWPSTSVSASGGLSRALASPVPLTSATGYQLGGSVGYPLDLAGGLRRGIEAAQDNAEAAAAARDEVRVTIAAAIARNYAAACSANRTFAVTERVLDLQRQTLNQTERLFRAGRGTAFDVTRAQAAVNQSAAALPAIIASRQTALFELAVLLGRPPAEYPQEVASCRAPHQPNTITDGQQAR